MCGSKPPPPPDMSAMAEASMESAKLWEAVARDQLAWAKQQDEQSQKTLQQVLGVQLPAMVQQYEAAVRDRARYEETFLPLQDQFIQEAQEYDTPERREQMAAQRQADVAAQFESQRLNAEQALQGYGIDPGQLRSNALDRNIRAQQAAAGAMAGNQGRTQVETVGRALRADAVNMGQGLPSQAAGGFAGAVGAGSAGMGGANQTTGAISGAMQGATAAGGLSQAGIGQSANITNMGYQNQMAHHEAGQAGIQGMGMLAGQLGSAALLSDPKAKENREPVGGALDAIGRAPAEKWDYRPETGMDDGAQHVGPMADDVRREMGIGDGTALPVGDMIGAHHAALAEVAERLKRLEGAFAIPDDTLKTLGRDVLESLIEKRSTKSAQRKQTAASGAIPA